MRTHKHAKWIVICWCRDVEVTQSLMTLSAAEGTGWLTGLSLWQLAPRPQQLKQKNGSPGLEQDMSQHISSSRREFWGCEATPQVVGVDQSPLASQETTMLLCYDRPKTNHSYYISQRSAPLGHICFIWSQGVSYVLTQPYIISYVLISLRWARSRPIL